MKKSILNLAGAQELSKAEQKNINGGLTPACADAVGTGVCRAKSTFSPPVCPAGWTSSPSNPCPINWCCQ